MAASPMITVVLPSALCARGGGPAELALSVSSVRAALAEIERREPSTYRSLCDETGALRKHLNLFVNTTHVRDRGGLDSPLAPGDVVTILAAVSGG